MRNRDEKYEDKERGRKERKIKIRDRTMIISNNEVVQWIKKERENIKTQIMIYLR